MTLLIHTVCGVPPAQHICNTNAFFAMLNCTPLLCSDASNAKAEGITDNKELLPTVRIDLKS